MGSDSLFEQLYAELRALAEQRLKHERRNHTLQPTALVHEVWIKMRDQLGGSFADRSHALAVMSEAMRRILTDHARGNRATKRRGDRKCVTLADDMRVSAPQDVDLIDLDDALTDFEPKFPRQYRALKCHMLGGMSTDEIATEIGVSATTAKDDLRFAKAWLGRQLKASGLQ
jgi:RNA polymerase sigma factor (TIGR02999 family)